MDPVSTVESDAQLAEVSAAVTDELLTETLVEEVSIDGMCGVY